MPARIVWVSLACLALLLLVAAVVVVPYVDRADRTSTEQLVRSLEQSAVNQYPRAIRFDQILRSGNRAGRAPE